VSTQGRPYSAENMLICIRQTCIPFCSL